MDQIDQVNQELKKLNRQIKEWEESPEELHDERNRLDREIRKTKGM